ncbi:MAG: XRE family transcriptional regulator, partial [Clostridia bacterium]|nr:XRE family transcriptional regulator [Clostridia bacterium]
MDIREAGQKIAKLRRNNNITQEELAEKIGVSSQAVSKWENGKNMPDIENLMLIAKLFNVPYSFFIEDESDGHLEYRSRLFNEDNMYTKVKTLAQLEGLEQTLKALEFMRTKHNGQYRKQSKYSGDSERIKYINHPLMMACHAHAMGIKDDNILSAILLHDVVEDTDTAINELPVNEETK